METVTTDSNGFYVFTDVPPGDYLIEPVDTTYDFAPTYYEITLGNDDMDNVNFLAYPDSSSGVIDTPSDEQITMKCYPNPASDFIILTVTPLEAGENLEIKLFTLAGETIFYEKVNCPGRELKYKIDLPVTSKGILVIAAYYRNQCLSGKVIVN
jgi:hypothetical protein